MQKHQRLIDRGVKNEPCGKEERVWLYKAKFRIYETKWFL